MTTPAQADDQPAVSSAKAPGRAPDNAAAGSDAGDDASHHASDRSELKAAGAAFIGSTLVGSVPMFATGLYRHGMDAASLLFWRYWIAMTILAPLAWWTSPGLREEWARAGRPLLINAMTLGVLQTYTYFRAVETLPSSVVVTLFFTYPILTLAIDRVVFGKAVGWVSVAAVILVFVGAMLTGWPSLVLQGGDAVGIACAIATPFGFAAYMAVAYRYTRQCSAFAGAAAMYLGLALAYAIVVQITGLKLPVDAAGWGSVLFIAIIGGVVQICSFAYALPRLSASGYSVIVSMELVTVVLLGVLVLGEKLTLVQATGILLVAFGVLADRLYRARGS